MSPILHALTLLALLVGIVRTTTVVPVPVITHTVLNNILRLEKDQVCAAMARLVDCLSGPIYCQWDTADQKCKHEDDRAVPKAFCDSMSIARARCETAAAFCKWDDDKCKATFHSFGVHRNAKRRYCMNVPDEDREKCTNTYIMDCRWNPVQKTAVCNSGEHFDFKVQHFGLNASSIAMS